MFQLYKRPLLCVILFLFSVKICSCDVPVPPQLVLYIPGDPEYTDVLARRVHDDLTLTCELRGETGPSRYVWNYIPSNENGTPSTYTVKTEPGSSQLLKQNLSESDSGQYLCTVPPFSASKHIVVQTKGPKHCAHSSYWCGLRCVPATYVCDGYPDCEFGEDESEALCGMRHICQRSDKLNCSSGRCVSETACCRAHAQNALCKQHACCEEYPRYSRHEGFVEFEYPPLFDDRHAPDDYGFIQSTIYTVTACALIFMIAVVLLVSAICKMHMKRAALRSYAHAERATRHHYNVQYAQAQRFPPCYEASRLLEQEARSLTSPGQSPHESPTRQNLQCNSECPPTVTSQCTNPPRSTGMGLARLSAIFSSRYRQVPTQPPEVEMTLHTTSNGSPNRQIQNYRSPTYCDLNSEYVLNSPDSTDCARNLNLEDDLARRNTLERVIDQIDRQRLTLQVGRFQLTLPTLPNLTSFRRNSERPDTPNVTEVDLQDLDFVRLGSNDTYTLNGRTIRLLGANFENYPIVGGSRPPPYTEAMRYKLYGPPPEYLSREGLNRDNQTDQEARSNVEMPPCYDDVDPGASNQPSENNNISVISNDNNTNDVSVIGNNNNIDDVSVIGNNNNTEDVPVINNNNNSDYVIVISNNNNNDQVILASNCNNDEVTAPSSGNTDDVISTSNSNSNSDQVNVTSNHGRLLVTNNSNNDESGNRDVTNVINNDASVTVNNNNNTTDYTNAMKSNQVNNNNSTVTNTLADSQSSEPVINVITNNNSGPDDVTIPHSNFESLNSVIDNLPAIDSDVNAN